MEEVTPETPKACSIVRWAGSKTQLLPALLDRLPADFGDYHEPFAGSASLCLSLVNKRGSISDINNDLICFYKELVANPESLYESVCAIPQNAENYYRIRSSKTNVMSQREIAIRFWYLNRNCFNGIYRENKKGNFNVPIGTKMGAYPSLVKFLAASKALSNFAIYSHDFDNVVNLAKKDDLVYLDPPYSRSGGKFSGEYSYRSFRSVDLDRLFEVAHSLNNSGVKVMISYASSDDVIRLFSDWSVEVLTVKRKVASKISSRNSQTELLIRNY